MRIPKYIQKALATRARCAVDFSENDYKIAEFLEKNDIAVEEYDILGGAESYVNPYESIRRIAAAIVAKEKK